MVGTIEKNIETQCKCPSRKTSIEGSVVKGDKGSCDQLCLERGINRGATFGRLGRSSLVKKMRSGHFR